MENQKQPTVALSTCQAEYTALAATIHECCPTDDMVADVMTQLTTKFKLIKFARFMFGD